MQTNPSTTVRGRLEPGLRVLVYQDPFTREDLEGEAVLSEAHGVGAHSDGFELWLVRFPDQEIAYSRLVHPDDLVRR